MIPSARPGKREQLARFIAGSGLLGVLEGAPASQSLLVLNYHRVGNSESTPYDPTVYSATAEELRLQMEYVQRHCQVVSLGEVLGWIERGTKPAKRTCYVLVTFDDAYIDNYEIAFPILKLVGIPAVFFVPTAFTGTARLTWWDEIAYQLKRTERRRFTLSYPDTLEVDLDSRTLIQELGAVLGLYKEPATKDGDRFLQDLAHACDLPRPDSTAERCFCDWDELRAMLQSGMAVEAHTHTHPVLSQISADAQMEELVTCRDLLKEHLGIAPDTIAYPVGMRNSFTEETENAARRAGFRAAFSFYGGTNRIPLENPMDIRREAIGYQSMERFRAQVANGRAWSGFWP